MRKIMSHTYILYHKIVKNTICFCYLAVLLSQDDEYGHPEQPEQQVLFLRLMIVDRTAKKIATPTNVRMIISQKFIIFLLMR